jgi:general secretion pathway protein A
LQIILAGQLNLEAILEMEQLRQFGQRISRRCRLEPLEPGEVRPYIAWRISAALADPGRPVVARASERTRDAVNALPFTESAVRTIARISGRVPRVINLLCDRALERGRLSGNVAINVRVVGEAARDLKLPVPLSVSIVEQRTPLAILAVSALCAASIVVARQFPAPSAPAAITQGTIDTPVAAPAPTPQPPPELIPVAEAAAPSRSFELAVASFKTAARAHDVAGTLQQSGYPASVVASSEWQRVIVGPFDTRAAAEAARTALAALHFNDVGIRETR